MIKYIFRLFMVALVSTLGVGGGFGLLIFILILTGNGDQHAVQYGLVAGAVAGLAFTALFFCIMMPLDLLFRLSVASTSKGSPMKSILDNEQIREITLHGAPNKIHYACRQALLSIPGVKNVHDDAGNNKISASTGTSWRSSGEVIEVEIQKQDANQFLLHCISRPTINKVVFDYGKNFENVELWKKNIREFMLASTSFG